MRYRVLLLALSYALCGPVQSAAQDGPALKAPPPEASQFDFLVGEWTVDVTSKAPGTRRPALRVTLSRSGAAPFNAAAMTSGRAERSKRFRKRPSRAGSVATDEGDG